MAVLLPYMCVPLIWSGSHYKVDQNAPLNLSRLWAEVHLNEEYARDASYKNLFLTVNIALFPKKNIRA